MTSMFQSLLRFLVMKKSPIPDKIDSENKEAGIARNHGHTILLESSCQIPYQYQLPKQPHFMRRQNNDGHD